MQKNISMGMLKLNASGVVSIFRIINNKRELLLTRSNNILPLSRDVVARLLGNFIIGKVNNIKVFNSGLELATGIISQYTHPATNQVQFVAVFDEASFSGSFDKLVLSASNMGPFAELTDVDGIKSDTEQIAITWSVSIDPCGDEPLPIVTATFSFVNTLEPQYTFLLHLSAPIDGTITVNQMYADGYSAGNCFGGTFVAGASRVGDFPLNSGDTDFGISGGITINGDWTLASKYRMFDIMINGSSVNNGDIITVGSYQVKLVIPSCQAP